MKRISVIFIIGLVLVACSEEIQPLKSLEKGMPNTIILSTGDVVYDINGEWDMTRDAGAFGTAMDTLKITQEGNKFVGITLIGHAYMDKGDTYIKGELEKNGFKSIERFSSMGWFSSIGKIDEGCNKIVIKTVVGDKNMIGTNKNIVTLIRK